MAANIVRSLPSEFSFYHLGQVQLDDSQPDMLDSAELSASLSDLQCVSFTFYGDQKSFLILTFEKGLDSSTYTEMGNVLASMTATALGKNEGIDIMISPPRSISPQQVSQMVLAGGPVTRKIYLHIHKNQAIEVQALVLTAPSEGAAYA